MEASNPPLGNGRLTAFRLDRLERDVDRVDREKADAKDFESLSRVVRDGFERIDKRFNALDERNKQEQKEAQARRRQTLFVIFGAFVSIITALISTGNLG